jgi:hypothetical protein
MKHFLILHYGFIRPTPEEMEAWNQWFASIADRQVERGHFPVGREISSAGIKELPLSRNAITGYTLITAEDLDEAQKIAQACPFVNSTRVYEVMGEVG